MKLTQRKVWLLGIATVAVLVVIVFLNRRGNELTVHLTDKAGMPLPCAVRVEERSDVPFLCSLKFLPLQLRYISRERSFDAADGIFRVKYISKRRSTDHEERICVMDIFWRGGLQSHILYYATTNGCLITPVFRGRYGQSIKVEPGQTEAWIELPPRAEL